MSKSRSEAEQELIPARAYTIYMASPDGEIYGWFRSTFVRWRDGERGRMAVFSTAELLDTDNWDFETYRAADI